MKDYSSQKYDEARNKIKKFRNKKLDWEIIKKGNTEMNCTKNVRHKN